MQITINTQINMLQSVNGRTQLIQLCWNPRGYFIYVAQGSHLKKHFRSQYLFKFFLLTQNYVRRHVYTVKYGRKISKLVKSWYLLIALYNNVWINSHLKSRYLSLLWIWNCAVLLYAFLLDWTHGLKHIKCSHSVYRTKLLYTLGILE